MSNTTWIDEYGVSLAVDDYKRDSDGKFAKTNSSDIDELDAVIRGEKKATLHQHMHLYDLGYDKSGAGYVKGDRKPHPNAVRGNYPKEDESDHTHKGKDKEKRSAKKPKINKAAAKEYKEKGTKAKAFKSWFGDWENDPAGASKVVNAEGEPQETHGAAKKVYHGTYGQFDAFDKSKAKPANVGTGFYFAENREVANSFGEVIE